MGASLRRAAGMNPAARSFWRAARLIGRVLSARAGQNGRALDGTHAWQHREGLVGEPVRKCERLRGNMNISSHYPSRSGGHFL